MMELAADPGLNLLTYTAEPGSKSDEALNLLGSWAATIEQEQTAPQSRRSLTCSETTVIPKQGERPERSDGDAAHGRDAAALERHPSSDAPSPKQRNSSLGPPQTTPLTRMQVSRLVSTHT